MAFVLDASVTLAWAFADENQHPVAVRAADLLMTGSEVALVPELWWYEVRSILLMGEGRGRISSDGTMQFLLQISQLRIQIDEQRTDGPLLELARRHSLTVYDAAYLALALRESLPFATLDKTLAAAAMAERVPLLA
ncbi:MAG TPA: type II toxin-antitoxin system VapC family toxin [Terracidiphilus sp.]|jgi:predicted nucleic acid-binding protein|nr:type II toxin-antitoxin system VapC family toxin [Terracidiphilus sp.]